MKVQYIGCLVNRDPKTSLFERHRDIYRTTQREGFMESIAENGDTVALWEYHHNDTPLSRKDAADWIEMTVPDYVYVKNSDGEMILANADYARQVGED